MEQEQEGFCFDGWEIVDFVWTWPIGSVLGPFVNLISTLRSNRGKRRILGYVPKKYKRKTRGQFLTSLVFWLFGTIASYLLAELLGNYPLAVGIVIYILGILAYRLIPYRGTYRTLWPKCYNVWGFLMGFYLPVILKTFT